MHGFNSGDRVRFTSPINSSVSAYATVLQRIQTAELPRTPYNLVYIIFDTPFGAFAVSKCYTSPKNLTLILLDPYTTNKLGDFPRKEEIT